MVISDNNTHIIFEINDYGKGFSDESLKKATQKFFTDDTSRTNHNYGLGFNFAKQKLNKHDDYNLAKVHQNGGDSTANDLKYQ